MSGEPAAVAGAASKKVPEAKWLYGALALAGIASAAAAVFKGDLRAAGAACAGALVLAVVVRVLSSREDPLISGALRGFIVLLFSVACVLLLSRVMLGWPAEVDARAALAGAHLRIEVSSLSIAEPFKHGRDEGSGTVKAFFSFQPLADDVPGESTSPKLWGFVFEPGSQFTNLAEVLSDKPVGEYRFGDRPQEYQVGFNKTAVMRLPKDWDQVMFAFHVGIQGPQYRSTAVMKVAGVHTPDGRWAFPAEVVRDLSGRRENDASQESWKGKLVVRFTLVD